MSGLPSRLLSSILGKVQLQRCQCMGRRCHHVACVHGRCIKLTFTHWHIKNSATCSQLRNSFCLSRTYPAKSLTDLQLAVIKCNLVFNSLPTLEVKLSLRALQSCPYPIFKRCFSCVTPSLPNLERKYRSALQVLRFWLNKDLVTFAFGFCACFHRL